MARKGPHRYGPYERAHKDDTADRMYARRLMIRKYGKKAAKGMHVDHIRSIKGGGDPRNIANLRFRDPHENVSDKTYYD